MSRIKRIGKKCKARDRVFGREGKVKLGVISVHVIRDTRILKQIGKWSGVESEKEWVKYRALRDDRLYIYSKIVDCL